MSWRKTLFCWRGAVDGRQWTGAWLGSTSGDFQPPSPRQYENAASTFRASAAPDEKEEVYTEPHDYISGLWSARYFLDNGDGLEEYHDASFELRYEMGSGRVVGLGRNEFGHFVMDGWLKDVTMVLRRRYLDDGDFRVEMDLSQLMGLSPDSVVALQMKRSKKKAKKTA